LLEVGEQQALSEAVSRCILGSELPIGFGDSHNLNFWIVERLLQKSLDVSMNEANDADTERGVSFRRRSLALAMCGCEQGKREDERYRDLR